MNLSPKLIAEKLKAAINAWFTLRPNATYAGMTLAQFTALVQPSLDLRAEIEQLNTQLVAKQDQRDAADEASMEAQKRLVAGIRAVEGDDSEVLEPMGYTRRTERKSGLTRGKSGNGNAPTPP